MEGTLNQPYVALLCVYLGAGGACLYFAWAGLARLLRLGQLWRNVGEALCCLFYATAAVWVFYRLLNLRLRGFYLLGMLLGALLYRQGLHALLAHLLHRIYKFTGKFRRKND